MALFAMGGMKSFIYSLKLNYLPPSQNGSIIPPHHGQLSDSLTGPRHSYEMKSHWPLGPIKSFSDRKKQK